MNNRSEFSLTETFGIRAGLSGSAHEIPTIGAEDTAPAVKGPEAGLSGPTGMGG